MKILKQKVRSLQKYNKLKYPVRYMYNAENCEKLWKCNIFAEKT